MNEKDRYSQNRPEPWEQDFYQTGSTRPPKSYGGLIAFLVAAVIFLGGIASAMGMLNIHLFREAEQEEPLQDASVKFSPEESVPPASLATEPPLTEVESALLLQPTPQSVENIPQEGGLSLQQIYENAIDSVVSIACSKGTGTGVVLSVDGYLITNAHVVEGGTGLSALFTDGRELSARIVGLDTVSDLAVLQVEAEDLTPATFGDSASLRVGDAVVAIGDPLGVALRGTMTNGIVSAINRDITTDGRTMTLIQTNAALNSGNSGGPLLNCYGQVVRINTMKIGDYMNQSGVEGLGFAIPSTTVKQIVDQLISQGYVSGRPSTGFTGQAITAFDRLYYRLPQGLYITQVDPNSHAAALGITPGDILLQLGDVRILDNSTLEECLYAYSAGDTVSVIFYRSGNQYRAELQLEEAKQ